MSRRIDPFSFRPPIIATILSWPSTRFDARMPSPAPTPLSRRGQWMTLAAALLGWMFDGLEMGLFPLVAGPALGDLLGTSDQRQVTRWVAVITAGFLVGAATG